MGILYKEPEIVEKMSKIETEKMSKESCQKCGGGKREGGEYEELCSFCANDFNEWRKENGRTRYPIRKDDDYRGVVKLAVAVIQQSINDLNDLSKNREALSFFRGSSFQVWCSILGYGESQRLRIKKHILEVVANFKYRRQNG